MGFGMNLDSTGQTWHYVTALLERGIRVLSVSREVLETVQVADIVTVRRYPRLHLQPHRK
jgi:hypothetical protein